MRLKNVVLALLGGVIFSVTGISIFWLHEPHPITRRPALKIVTQTYGEPVAIAISPILYGDTTKKYKLHISVLNSKGMLVHRINSYPMIKGRRYMIVTMDSLEPGLFEVIATVEYELNPMRTVSEDTQIAILKVLP